MTMDLADFDNQIQEAFEEEWRIIPSFPEYEASSLGRIRRRARGASTRPGRILQTPPARTGYLKAPLSIRGCAVHKTVHFLVADAFLGPRPAGHHINHKDFDKANCRPQNLEYVTREQNEEHARRNGRKADSWRDILSLESPTRKLEAAQVIAIRLMRSSGTSEAELSTTYHVSKSQIGRICRRERWGWLE
jgi:HNH endonuclease/NUMOD4 motif-containing protein